MANLDVLAVRVAGAYEKEMILSSDPDVFFTEPHYSGFPAVLVRIAAIDEAELKGLLVEAWYCMASAELRERLARRSDHSWSWRRRGQIDQVAALRGSHCPGTPVRTP